MQKLFDDKCGCLLISNLKRWKIKNFESWLNYNLNHKNILTEVMFIFNTLHWEKNAIEFIAFLTKACALLILKNMQ